MAQGSGTFLRASTPALAAAVSIVMLPVAPPAAAQPCARWLEGLGVAGVSEPVLDAVAWDPDGAGPRPSGFVVVGGFDLAGDVPVGRVAFWDGERWEALGNLSGHGSAVAVIDGRLLVATHPPATSGGSGRVFEWTGAGWSQLGGDFTNGGILAFASYGGELYAGGAFIGVGGLPARSIVRFDGAAWRAAGEGVVGQVSDLQVFEGRLVAGGSFATAGGAPAANLAAWDGSAWASLPLGVDGLVEDLAVYNGELVVAGEFAVAGGQPAARLARWNGEAWLGGFGGAAPDAPVREVLVRGADLLIAGDFAAVGATPAARVARFDGQAWSALATSVRRRGYDLGSPAVYTLATDGPRVLAGGTFSGLGGTPSFNVAVLEGGAWRATVPGSDGPKLALASWRGDLIVGGAFSSFAGLPAEGVVAWDGLAWRALSLDADGEVSVLAVYNDELYAGGSFTRIGGVNAKYVARFDGQTWRPLGAGFDGFLVLTRAMEVHDGQLWITGQFTSAGGQPASGIARWNGQNLVPEPSFQAPRRGFALQSDGLRLFGGRESSGIRVLDAGVWSTPSAQPMFSSSVSSMTLLNGQLVASGGPLSSPVTNPVQVLENDVFVPLGPATWDRRAKTLTPFAGSIAAGGAFRTQNGNEPLNGVALWNGTRWSALGDGLGIQSSALGAERAVWDLLEFNGELFAAGDFSLASGRPSAFLARWTPTGAPWFARSPQSRSVIEGAGVTLTGRAAAGYGALEYRWLRDGNVVVDGPGGASAGGGVVSGAGTPELAIAGLRASDAGSYVLQARTDGCPWGASAAAVLTVTPACRGDVNGDGELTFDDIALFVAFFNANDPRADFNSDGEWTFDDITIFVGLYNAGC